MKKRCRHESQHGLWWLRGRWALWAEALKAGMRWEQMAAHRCNGCGAWMPMTPATDTPSTAIELRAALLAADFVEGVGIGGHRPDHCTGEHCWHWFEADHSEDADQCCYCGHDGTVLPGIENDCQSGYLAHCIATHKDSTP